MLIVTVDATVRDSATLSAFSNRQRGQLNLIDVGTTYVKQMFDICFVIEGFGVAAGLCCVYMTRARLAAALVSTAVCLDNILKTGHVKICHSVIFGNTVIQN